MRKFLSVLLAMAMVLSLTVTGFAIEDTATTREPEVMTEEATMAGKTVILHTNDVHGAIAGYAYITALKADYEAKGAEVILVDAGDYSQGTSYVSVTKGLDAIEMMNAAGYDVVTLGNHEFDYGYTQLKDNMTKAKFKVLCADVFNADGTPIFDANYTYTTKSGVKVGFFGMETPETQTKANPTKITPSPRPPPTRSRRSRMRTLSSALRTLVLTVSPSPTAPPICMLPSRASTSSSTVTPTP